MGEESIRYTRRRNICSYTAEDAIGIDYKDINTLKQYIASADKIDK